MNNEEKAHVLQEMKQEREAAELAISKNETAIERLRAGGELAPDAEYKTVEQEIAALEHYSAQARDFIYESEQIEIYSDEDREEILEKGGLQALRNTYTEEDPEYAGISEEIAGGTVRQGMEQASPKPLQIENNKLGELDPMAGHPMAGEGRANQEWREDIGKALAVADELTAKGGDVEQAPEAVEISERQAWRDRCDAKEEQTQEQSKNISI